MADENDYEITESEVEIAEKLFGLHFKPEDRKLAMNKINANLQSYKKLRQINLPNNVPPSLLFIPKIVKNLDTSETKFLLPNHLELPEDLNELAYYPILDLAYFIKNQLISCTQLCQMFLDRIQKYDDKIKAVISLNPLALQRAKALDELLSQGTYLGPLHGIPFGAKDLLAYPDLPTTWGTPPYREQMIDTKATIIDRLEEKGAIMLAKVSLGELAWGDVWFGGTTKTPWNTEFGSSGSSAGSAASVASGFMAFAIGSETLGSIVSPSTRCGVTGLRPTFGRVSRFGAMALSWSMDKLGPICHTVEDCALIFQTILGSDGRDNTVVDEPFSWNLKKPMKSLKVGYLKDEFSKDETHQFWNTRVFDTLKGQGIELHEVKLPDLPFNDIVYILHCEAATAFDDLTLSGQVDDMVRQGEDTWPNVFRWARFIPAVEYIKANRIRTLLIDEMNKLFDSFDIVIGPSLGNNLSVTNLTGHPCVVVPTGFKDEKLPTSITFMSGLFEEEKLLRFAKFYQDLTDYHKAKPNLD